MRAIRVSFVQLVAMLRKDMMLLVACVSPVLIGLIFRFGFPFLENLLCDWLEQSAVIAPYYSIFDMFLAIITPFFYCFVSAMIVLEERDEHMLKALVVSPLGQRGYYISRIGLPGILAFLVTAILLPICALSSQSVWMLLCMMVIGTLQGIIFALLIISCSSNKLEGVAVTKLSSLIMMGVIIPCFVPQKLQYVFFFLPSFWMGKAVWTQWLSGMAVAVCWALIWIYLLGRIAKRRINR